MGQNNQRPEQTLRVTQPVRTQAVSVNSGETTAQALLAKKRINNELKDLTANPPQNWKVQVKGDFQWNVWICAPTTCPFHSVEFVLKVTFQPTYPYSVPRMVLDKPQSFFHPNISEEGNICETNLKQQDPEKTMRKRIDGFIYFLSNPNLQHGLNTDALELLRVKGNERNYYRQAYARFRKYW